LRAARQLERSDLEAAALENPALDALAVRQYERARTYFEQGLDAARTVDDPERPASLQVGLARTALALGQVEQARAHLIEAARRLPDGAAPGLAPARRLVEALLAAALDEDAAALFEQSLGAARKVGNPWDEIDAIESFAAYCRKTGYASRLEELSARLGEIRSALE